jgi:3-hydroxybutyryl-CoA dehydrogenase
VLDRVDPVNDLVPADLMVEAVIEDAAVKEDVFRRADETLPSGAVLASNTSSIPISTLAAATDRPDRVIGMHFFNPVPMMSLVEVVRGKETSDETAAAITELARELGKTPAVANDFPGFVSNRIWYRSSTGPWALTKASPSRAIERSRSSGSPTRWARSRSPT